MAPKKRQPQKPKQASRPNTTTAKPSASSCAKLQLSAENESRLRRLLLNNASGRWPESAAPADDPFSDAQKAKRLKSVYEKLSCEGFSNDQIERALSAFKEVLSMSLYQHRKIGHHQWTYLQRSMRTLPSILSRLRAIGTMRVWIPTNHPKQIGLNDMWNSRESWIVLIHGKITWLMKVPPKRYMDQGPMTELPGSSMLLAWMLLEPKEKEIRVARKRPSDNSLSQR